MFSKHFYLYLCIFLPSDGRSDLNPFLVETGLSPTRELCIELSACLFLIRASPIIIRPDRMDYYDSRVHMANSFVFIVQSRDRAQAVNNYFIQKKISADIEKKHKEIVSVFQF